MAARRPRAWLAIVATTTGCRTRCRLTRLAPSAARAYFAGHARYTPPILSCERLFLWTAWTIPPHYAVGRVCENKASQDSTTSLILHYRHATCMKGMRRCLPYASPLSFLSLLQTNAGWTWGTACGTAAGSTTSCVHAMGYRAGKPRSAFLRLSPRWQSVGLGDAVLRRTARRRTAFISLSSFWQPLPRIYCALSGREHREEAGAASRTTLHFSKAEGNAKRRLNIPLAGRRRAWHSPCACSEQPQNAGMAAGADSASYATVAGAADARGRKRCRGGGSLLFPARALNANARGTTRASPHCATSARH